MRNFLQQILLPMCLAGCSSLGSDTGAFKASPSKIVVSERAVINRKAPIIFVLHSAQDEQWAFLSGIDLPVDPTVYVTLDVILSIDSTVGELEDLPKGWKAFRSDRGKDWQRACIDKQW